MIVSRACLHIHSRPHFPVSIVLGLQALSLQFDMEPVRNGVRTYLHRLIVCMGEGILPIMPQALASMLDVTTCQIHDLKEFVPLINQIIDKFKAKVRSESSNLAEKATDQNPMATFLFTRSGTSIGIWGCTACYSGRRVLGGRVHRPQTILIPSILTTPGIAVIFFRWNPC